MTMHVRLFARAALVTLVAASAHASWVFHPSYYTHAPETGERVTQYTRPLPLASIDNYRQSGYRHSTTVLRGGDSTDRVHVVETWGEGENIRPYGEWLRPYREGATPYGPWGNPQGPWTTPQGALINPYGQWNRFPPGYYYPPVTLPPTTPEPTTPAESLPAPAPAPDDLDWDLD